MINGLRYSNNMIHEYVMYTIYIGIRILYLPTSKSLINNNIFLKPKLRNLLLLY